MVGRPTLLLLLCLAGLAWLLSGCAPQPAPPVVWLAQAQRSAMLQEGGATPAPPAQTVTLPDVWDRSGRTGLWRYELTLVLDAAPTEVYGLYIPRAGNRLAVRVNGTLVAQAGQFEDDDTDVGLAPHLISVPVGLLHADGNPIQITVQGEAMRHAGLSAIAVGPFDALKPLYQTRHTLVTWGALTMVSVALVFALLTAALARLVHDRAFGLLALACLCFAIYALHHAVCKAPLAPEVWDAVAEWAHAGYLLALAGAVRQVLPEIRSSRSGWTELLLLAGALVLVPAYAWDRSMWAYEAWLVLVLLYAVALWGSVMTVAWRTRAVTPCVVAAGGLLALAMSAYSYLGSRLDSEGYTVIDGSRYSLLAVMCVLVWLLAERYRTLVRQRDATHAAGESELREQRRRLETRYELRDREARQQERRRILRDIHDGMGLQLTSLLSLTQDKAVAHERLTREVRIAIEQMRLLVDNADAFEGDVGMLLGQMRYQIGRRLTHTGTRLHWQTALSHPEKVLRPTQAIALQRLVFELTTNVLKHAQASRVEVLVRDDAAGALHLLFADNGVGVDESGHKPGIGLRSMQERAQEMGAQLVRQPGAPGTRYRLSLPPGAFE